ncbi:hypothetical protein [Virgibacillus necropolis]|uniref:hypothetical protein n=1 Tax=Virgibacillus necropolis TaxID=163877 RepID=UPI00137473E5|nr:hypothetical protein [Virgibacillus necropolis]
MAMSIKKIILHKLNMRLKFPFQTSFGAVQDKPLFIVEAIDAEEHSGFGESVAFPSLWN